MRSPAAGGHSSILLFSLTPKSSEPGSNAQVFLPAFSAKAAEQTKLTSAETGYLSTHVQGADGFFQPGHTITRDQITQLLCNIGAAFDAAATNTVQALQLFAQFLHSCLLFGL